MMPNRRLHLMMASVAFIGLSSPAFALDGADVVAKLNAAYSAVGTSIAYQSVAVDGTTVKLSGVSLKPNGASNSDYKVGDMTLEGVEENDGGGYHVDTVSLPDIDAKQGDATFTAKAISITGLTIPGNPSGGTINDFLMYETAGTGPVVVTAKGQPVFSIEKSEIDVAKQDGDTGFDFDATASGMKADLSDVDDAKSRDAIQKLGLTKVNGEMSMSGSWELKSGQVSLDEYAFDVDKVGRLSFSLDISGYTLEFMKAMQEATKAAAANPDKGQAGQAMGLAMMGLMQQLTFNSASIRFEDGSITKRVLDYIGGQQGVSGEQLAQSLKGMVPMMMAQLNVPELQNQVSTAVNTYLDDPKSLTIAAAPEKPVPFPMIAGAAMGAPTTVPSMLGVTVTAND